MADLKIESKNKMEDTKKQIGKEATVSCSDKHCPFHGGLSIRGRSFVGKVVKMDAHGTVSVEWPRLLYLQKYERYEKRRSRKKAHNPACINAKIGDNVTIMECKPISKTKNFVIIRKLGLEKGFKEKMEARETSKVTQKKEEIKEAQ